jgi:tetratricopeptide (TPR) repeat protein
MAERFGPGNDLHELAYLAHTCVLAPDALPDRARVIQLAEQRLALSSATSFHVEWSGHILGLAYYRAGQYEKAVACLDEDLKRQPTWEYAVTNWLVLAMAHQRLNHAAEAKRWLDRARQWVRERGGIPPEQGAPSAPPPAHAQGEGLVVRLLLREAEGVLGKD